MVAFHPVRAVQPKIILLTDRLSVRVSRNDRARSLTREEFLILKAKVIARRALLAKMAMSPTGYILNDEQMGVLLIIGGLSVRTDGAPVSSKAVQACVFEEAAFGIIIRETGWLRQTGHIIEADPGYIVSDFGWSTLDQHLIANERAACGEPSPDDPPMPCAKETCPDLLLMAGEWQITAEARRLTKIALQKARGRIA